MPATKVETPSSNGVVAMPIKTVTITFDEIGYDGWWCRLRTNPKSELWDRFLSDSEADKVWENFSPFILEWNFGDENGKALPLPPATKRDDLPIEIPVFMINKFVDAFNERTGLPKVPESNSSDT